MGRGFKPEHPEKLRGVIASAKLDRGLSVPGALRLLAQGQLPGWPGKYDLPLSTAQGYVAAEERRRRELLLKRADPGTVQTAVAGQVALLLAELDRRTRAVDRKTSTDAIRDLARAQRELVTTARACQTRSSSTDAPGPDSAQRNQTDDSDSKPGLLDQLAQQSVQTDNQPG